MCEGNAGSLLFKPLHLPFLWIIFSIIRPDPKYPDFDLEF